MAADDTVQSNVGASPEAGTTIVQTINNTAPAKGMKAWGQRVLLKWLAGGVGHPYVKQIRENLDEQEGRSKVNMMLAEEVGRQAIQDPKIVEQYKARILGDLWRKQNNLDAVAQEAEKIISDEVKNNENSIPDREPDADFFGAFTREAENASSEQLRIRLARLLAGEIRQPGSVGRATIRLVSDLDQDTLADFESIMDRRLRDAIVKGDNWGEGEMFVKGMKLQSAGLLHASNTFLSQVIKGDEKTPASLTGEEIAIAMTFNAPFSHSQPVWLLTQSGLEIARLLPKKHDERPILRESFEKFDKNNIIKAYLGPLVNTPQGAMVTHEELIFERRSDADQ